MSGAMVSSASASNVSMRMQFNPSAAAFVRKSSVEASVRTSALSPFALQLLELLLERFEPLAGFAELAFGGQPLIVGEVARGVGDERVERPAAPAAGAAAGSGLRPADGAARGRRGRGVDERPPPNRPAIAASNVGP